MTCSDCHDTGSIAMLTSRKPCPCKTAGIPDRGIVGDDFDSVAYGRGIVITCGGVDVSKRCFAFDRVAGTVECYILDPAVGGFAIVYPDAGEPYPARETLHGVVSVRWA